MLVIFDWDGTLCDSTGKIVRCVQRAARELSLPALEPVQIQEIIGLSLPTAVMQLYPDLDASGIDALATSYSLHYVADEHVPSFFEGAEAALAELAAAGFVLAVATGKSRKGLNRAFEQLDGAAWFTASRCADETASKPNPLMLKELLAECQRSHQDAVMVGDTEFDMAMAQNIGMARIGVSYGAHAPERLQRYAPVLCVDDLRHMVPWLLAERERLGN